MKKTIYLAGGCFWGVEHYLKQINGVLTTTTGYANGRPDLETVSYQDVYTDLTGFAETVRVEFDSDVLPLKTLLRLYFLCIEPTSLNRQGEDEGTRYRTGIYYAEPGDRVEIDDIFREVQSGYSVALAVEVGPILRFISAEEEHQDYLEKNPGGYCHLPAGLFEMARQANRRKTE